MPNFPLRAFQRQENVSAPLVYSFRSPSTGFQPFVIDSGVRPRASASVPGEAFGVFTPIAGRTKTKVRMSLSSDSDSRSQRARSNRFFNGVAYFSVDF